MPLYSTIQQALQSFSLAFSGSAAASVAGSTAEASVLPSTGSGAKQVPAGWFQPGRTIRIILNGTYDAPTLPGTMLIKVKIGGVVVASGTASSLLSLAAAKGFRLSCTITARGTGSAVPVAAAGTFDYATSAFSRVFFDVVNASTTLDNTVALPIDVTVQHSVATGQGLTVVTSTIEMLT